jgi:SAM-dependent methyltransferase
MWSFDATRRLLVAHWDHPASRATSGLTPRRPADRVGGAGYGAVMNEAHKRCGSDEWRAIMRDSILPWAMGDVDLGDDVLEVGPGYGAVTDVLGGRVRQVTAVEIDGELATMLSDRYSGNDAVRVVHGDATALDAPEGRFSGAVCFTMLHHVPTAAMQDRLFAEVARVLRAGGVLVASDSLASDELASHHDGDTYNPVDPATLADRLTAAGFADADVRTNPYGWAAVAHR